MANGRHSFVAFYPSDWLAGTARLPRLHRSIYFDVCCYIWDAAKPVPARELALMLSDVPNWAEIVRELVEIGKLERLEDGAISNAKALHEAEKAYGAWQRMSDGGSKARSKHDAKGDHKGDGKGSPENQNQNQNQREETPNPFAGEAWDGWIEMRTKAKKAPTARAIKLSISNLAKLEAEGHRPEDVLNQSTMNGWTGLFAVKGNGNGRDRSGWSRVVNR